MGTWIPQLFYDLIARVVPGFITCVSFLMIYLIADQTCLQQIDNLEKLANKYSLWKDFPTTLIIVSGYAISYITGFLLRGLYAIFFFRCRDIHDDIKKEYVK